MGGVGFKRRARDSTAVKISYHRHFRLLRARPERPRCRAANKHNELAALQSITSSVRASTLPS
jgi:hypothetical protein